MDLEEARQAIASIDAQMAELFVQRMEAARDIASYKQERGLPVEDKEQEARVIAQRCQLVQDDDLRPFYVLFLQDTMDVCKEWQRHLIDKQ